MLAVLASFPLAAAPEEPLAGPAARVGAALRRGRLSACRLLGRAASARWSTSRRTGGPMAGHLLATAGKLAGLLRQTRRSRRLACSNQLAGTAGRIAHRPPKSNTAPTAPQWARRSHRPISYWPLTGSRPARRQPASSVRRRLPDRRAVSAGRLRSQIRQLRPLPAGTVAVAAVTPAIRVGFGAQLVAFRPR